MERTPQQRTRYTTPAQTQRGRDFSTFVRTAEPVQAVIAATEPASFAQQQAQPTPQPQVYAQPLQPQPQPATINPEQYAHLPIQYPQETHRQQIVAAPAPPPQQPVQQPQYQAPAPTQAAPQYQPAAPTVQPHQPYLPEEPAEQHWTPLHFDQPPADAAPPATGIRGKISTSLAGLKTYYFASPKRAAFIVGSSLLVLSAIGWTLAMQSSSANDLLAKTPFGFLLIKQGHTKGEQIVIYEDKPTSEQIANHRTPPNNPRYLSIPKFNLFSRILALESKGEGIELPENIYDIGWSTQSNPPADPLGTQLYIAHAKGITKTDAAFSRLGELKEGDELVVETGDGTKFTYVVMHTEKANVSSPNISRYYNSWVIGQPGLNLLTTSGVDPTQENPSENRYATFAVFTILKK